MALSAACSWDPNLATVTLPTVRAHLGREGALVRRSLPFERMPWTTAVSSGARRPLVCRCIYCAKPSFHYNFALQYIYIYTCPVHNSHVECSWHDGRSASCHSYHQTRAPCLAGNNIQKTNIGNARVCRPHSVSLCWSAETSSDVWPFAREVLAVTHPPLAIRERMEPSCITGAP